MGLTTTLWTGLVAWAATAAGAAQDGDGAGAPPHALALPAQVPAWVHEPVEGDPAGGGAAPQRLDLEVELARLELRLAAGQIDEPAARRADALRFSLALELEESAARGEPLHPLIGRTARLAAEAQLAVGNASRALEILRQPLPTAEQWRSRHAEARARATAPLAPLEVELREGGPLDTRALVAAALADPEHRRLVALATARLAALAGDGEHWLDELLEPWAADWFRAHFEVPSRAVYDAALARSTASGTGSHASWEVPSQVARLLSIDRSVTNADAVNLFASLCRVAPERCVELDRVLFEREGSAWRRTALQGLATYAAGYNPEELTMVKLAPIVAGILGDPALYRESGFAPVIERFAGRVEYAPVGLVEAWRAAILAGSPEDVALLLLPWGNVPEDFWGSGWPVLKFSYGWNRGVAAACLEHPDERVRAMVVGTFLGTAEGHAMLGWTDARDARLRDAARLQLAHRQTDWQGAGTLAPDDPIAVALERLVADPDPALRQAAVDLMLAAEAPLVGWLESALAAAAPDERVAIVAELGRRSTEISFRNPLAHAPELRARLAGDPDPELRAALVAGSWSHAERSTDVVERLAHDADPRVLGAVDDWLHDKFRQPGAGAVLLTRLAHPTLPLQAADLGAPRLREVMENHEDWAAFVGIALARGDDELLRLAVASFCDGRDLRSPGSWWEPGRSTPERDASIARFGDALGGEAVVEAIAGAWSGLAGRETIAASIVGLYPPARRAAAANPALPLGLRWRLVPIQARERDLTVDRFLALVDEASRAALDLGTVRSAFHPSDLAPLRGEEANRAARDWLGANPAPTAAEDDGESDQTARARDELRERVWSLLSPRHPGAVDLAVAILADFARVRGHTALPRAALGELARASDADERFLAALGAALVEKPHTDLVALASDHGVGRFVGPLAAIVGRDIENLGAYGRSTPFGVQVAAAQALRVLPGDPVAEAGLRQGMLNSNASVRDACRGVLESHELFLELERASTGVETVDGATVRLFALLKGDDPGLRAEAARGLATLGAVEALPDLIEALADPDEDVRAAARAALERLNGLPPRRTPADESPPSEG